MIGNRFLAVALILASIPAGAAPGPVATPDDPALRARVADCVAAAPPPGLPTWLDSLPGSGEDGALAGRFSIAPCMKTPGGWQRFGQRDAQFRMLVTDAIVRRRLAGLPAASPRPYSDARWFDAKLSALPAGAPVDRDALAIEDFGACIALKDWAGSLALLRTPRNSAEERAAAGRLGPVLAPCTSLNLRMDRPTLRLIVASGIYHLGIAPPRAAAAG